MCTVQHGVNKFAQNGAPQSRRQTEQWQMLDDTIASASINDIRVLPQKHSPGVGGLSSAMVVVASKAQQTCRIQQCELRSPDTKCCECARRFLFGCTVLTTQHSGQSVLGCLLVCYRTLATISRSREKTRRCGVPD